MATEIGRAAAAAGGQPAAAAATSFALGYRPELDGLRALAVLAVMLFHGRAPFMRGGYIGVDLFFVLSGFLITAILCAEIGRSGWLRLGRFYLRRALRLTPALLVMLACYIVVVLALAPEPRLLLLDVLIGLFYVANWTRIVDPARPDYLAHLWSLAIEEQFYLLWPPLLLVLVRRLSSPRLIFRVLVGGALAALVLRVALVHGGADPFRIYHGLDTRADALLAGCALGYGLAHGLIRAELPGAWRPPLLALSASGLLAIAVAAPWDAPLMLSVGYSVTAALSALLILLALGGTDTGRIEHQAGLPAAAGASWSPERATTGFSLSLSRLLRAAPLLWLGRRSYGLYLWHFPIMRVILLATDSWPLITVGGIALTVVAAALSYALIERPFLTLKGRLAAPAPGEARP